MQKNTTSLDQKLEDGRLAVYSTECDLDAESRA